MLHYKTRRQLDSTINVLDDNKKKDMNYKT